MKYLDSIREYYNATNVTYTPRKWNRTKPLQVLNDLIVFKSSQDQDKQRNDEYWLVFDHDTCDAEELKQVQLKAKLAKCKSADSKPCFELWLLLHFKALNKYRRLEASGDYTPCTPAERTLENEDSSYDKDRKGKYDAGKYMKKIETAIQNASTVDRTSADLPLNQIGSRVYKLAQSIIDASPNNPRN